MYQVMVGRALSVHSEEGASRYEMDAVWYLLYTTRWFSELF